MPLYLNKNYRKKLSLRGLISYEVKLKESDLYVYTEKNFYREALGFLARVRSEIEEYIALNKDFLYSFSPVKPHPSMAPAPRVMAEASLRAGVGPMAAVAGTVAGFVGEKLLEFSDEVVVENGGDIYMKLNRPARAAVFAGESPLSMKIGVKVNPRRGALSLCSSSGTVGHSLSGGNADAALCIAREAALADAAATAVANSVQAPGDIEKGLSLSRKIRGIRGSLIICGDKMGAWGDMELCRVD